MKIRARDIPDEKFKYCKLVKVYAGRSLYGEIEMETSCPKLAMERIRQQKLEIWQMAEFEKPKRFELDRQEKILYKYLKQAYVSEYRPIARDIRNLSELSGMNRNSCQRALKGLKDGGVISAHMKRGKINNLYIKL